MDTNDLFYLIFLKYNILNNNYQQLLKTAIEENNALNLLDEILLLLEREPNFVYFDDDIFDYLYNLNNEIRFEYRSADVFLKCADIIIKLNKLRNVNIKEKRIEFFREEWFLRTGQREYFDEEVCNKTSNNLKQLFNHDFKFMCELAVPNGIYISDNIFYYLSSLSYFANKYNDIFDDDVIENLLLIVISIDVAIEQYYNKNIIDSNEYESSKRIITSIHESFFDYYERNKDKKKELQKLVHKVEN